MANKSDKRDPEPRGDSSGGQRASAPAPAPSTGSPAPGPTSGSILLPWLLSQTVRHAIAVCKHVRKILNHQRDLLTPKALEEVQAATLKVRNAAAARATREELEKQVENLENTANKWLKPYPNAALRENVEVLLVALTVAMAVRTFFLQPFKIPTGSMQPTLYGVRSENLLNQPDFQIPGFFMRLYDWTRGTSYVRVVASKDGVLEEVSQPWPAVLLSVFQRIKIGGQWQTIWFPPDYGSYPLQHPLRANLQLGQFFHKGEEIVKLKVDAGDHLFVNRVSYNFRPPERGEIIVFETHGITRLAADQQDTFYIKRLVGLGGEALCLQPEYELTMVPGQGKATVGRLKINGQSLSAATPHFSHLYSFSDVARGMRTVPYHENRYYGHSMMGVLDGGRTFEVRPNHLFVLGDNTMNSSDSRVWEDFPKEKVIGKSFFVYWPLTDRFGWGHD